MTPIKTTLIKYTIFTSLLSLGGLPAFLGFLPKSIVILTVITNNITPLATIVVVTSFKGVPRQAEVAQGLPGSLRPRIFLTFRHYKDGRSSDKRTGRFYLRRNPRYSLSEAESTSGHMVLYHEKNPQ